MPGPESVRGYLDAVEAQIRWKRARTVAARELETHLEDQQEEFLAEGHPPEEAERLAVEDMGDPVAVGADLDRLHRPRPQWGMLGLTLALLLVGGMGLFTLGVDMCVVVHRSQLEFVIEFAKFLISHVNRYLLLNSLLVHLDSAFLFYQHDFS